MDYPAFRNAIESGSSYLDRFHLHVGLLDPNLSEAERASSLRTAILCYNLVERRRLTARLEQEIIYVSYSPEPAGSGPILFFPAEAVFLKYKQGLLPLLVRLLIRLLHRSTLEVRNGFEDNHFYLNMGFFLEDPKNRSCLTFGPSPNEAIAFERRIISHRLHRIEQRTAVSMAGFCQESYGSLIKLFRHNLYLNALLNTCRHSTWELTSLSPHVPLGVFLSSNNPAYSLWGLTVPRIMELLQGKLSSDLLVGIPESEENVFILPTGHNSAEMVSNLLEAHPFPRYHVYRYHSASGTFTEIA